MFLDGGPGLQRVKSDEVLHLYTTLTKSLLHASVHGCVCFFAAYYRCTMISPRTVAAVIAFNGFMRKRLSRPAGARRFTPPSTLTPSHLRALPIIPSRGHVQFPSRASSGMPESPCASWCSTGHRSGSSWRDSERSSDPRFAPSLRRWRGQRTQNGAGRRDGAE